MPACVVLQSTLCKCSSSSSSTASPHACLGYGVTPGSSIALLLVPGAEFTLLQLAGIKLGTARARTPRRCVTNLVLQAPPSFASTLVLTPPCWPMCSGKSLQPPRALASSQTVTLLQQAQHFSAVCFTGSAHKRGACCRLTEGGAAGAEGETHCRGQPSEVGRTRWRIWNSHASYVAVVCRTSFSTLQKVQRIPSPEVCCAHGCRGAAARRVARAGHDVGGHAGRQGRSSCCTGAFSPPCT